MQAGGHDVRDGFDAVERITKPCLDLLRELRVVPTLVPERLDGGRCVHVELVDERRRRTVLGHHPDVTEALLEHSPCQSEQHELLDLPHARSGWGTLSM